MPTSNQKSNSSASTRKATKRKATPRGKEPKKVKAPKASKSLKAPKASKAKSQASRATKRTNNSVRTSTRRTTSSSRLSLDSATSRTSRSSLKINVATSPRRDNMAAPSASSRRSGTPKKQGVLSGLPGGARIAFVGAVTVAVLAVVGLVLLLVLSRMPVFVVQSIDAVASEHVTADNIAKLANVEEGTTLLSVDVNQIQENVQRNPWVKSVSVTREFPDTLGISVEERQVGAIVVIGAGTSVWALGSDGIWIEPVQLDTSGVDVATAALNRATELGCLLITDVPASVDPAQGSPTTDETILAVLDYQEQLSSDISSQARVYYASSTGSISVVLDSGLEISLGSPEDINSKSLALSEIMATYPGQLTYINVRVATKPTYRKVPDGTTLSSVHDVIAANAASAAAATTTTQDATTDDSQDSGDSSDSSDDSYDDTYDDTYDDSYDDSSDSSDYMDDSQG